MRRILLLVASAAMVVMMSSPGPPRRPTAGTCAQGGLGGITHSRGDLRPIPRPPITVRVSV
jgi:hypothetical protein